MRSAAATSNFVALRYTFNSHLADVVSWSPQGNYGDPIDVRLAPGNKLGARFHRRRRRPLITP